MRWLVFAVFTYLLFAVELGMSSLFQVNDVAPSVILVYVIFIAALAPVPTVMWAAMILGVITDLTAVIPLDDAASSAAPVVVLGPHALGYSLAGVLAVQLRSFLDRRHPLTIAIMVVVAGICAHLLAVFVISIRSLFGNWFSIYPDIAWSPTDQLVRRFLLIVFSAVVALPLGWMLLRLAPLFAFDLEHHYVQRR